MLIYGQVNDSYFSKFYHCVYDSGYDSINNVYYYRFESDKETAQKVYDNVWLDETYFTRLDPKFRKYSPKTPKKIDLGFETKRKVNDFYFYQAKLIWGKYYVKVWHFDDGTTYGVIYSTQPKLIYIESK